MPELMCKDYGFECSYTVSGDESTVADSFRDHMESEHGIEYTREAILQFIIRKKG